MKEALSSSETSVLTRATRRDMPDDAVLHSHRRKNLKPCSFINCLKTERKERDKDMKGIKNGLECGG
jgi:hypothetical protein